MTGFMYDHYASSPLRDSRGKEIGVERMKFFSSLDEFSAYIRGKVAEGIGLRDQEAASDHS